MGRATSLTFAREGAQVVGCDVAVEPAEETVALVTAAGGEMVSLQPCRLSEPTDCANLIELAIGEYGRVDVLFNLAGRSHFGLVEEVTDDEWEAAHHDEDRRGRERRVHFGEHIGRLAHDGTDAVVRDDIDRRRVHLDVGHAPVDGRDRGASLIDGDCDRVRGHA